MRMSSEQECGYLELKERVSELESKMEKRDKEFELLESEKLVVEKELMNLKDSNREEADEEPLIEQMMVNKALEFEKQVAEKEAEDWKKKFEKLVEVVQKLEETGRFKGVEWEFDENLKSGLELAGINLPENERSIGKRTKSCKVSEEAFSKEGLDYHQSSDSPYIITTPVQEYNLGRRSRDNVAPRKRVYKMLFEDDPHRSTDVVELSDSEDKPVNVSDKSESDGDKYEDEDMEVNTSTPLPGHKRRRVITSDDEDDDIPISILKNLKPSNQETSDLVDTPTTEENGNGKRRVSSRLRKQRNSTERLVGIPRTGNAEDDETEEEESEQGSESKSLDGFIVDDDDDDDEGFIVADDADEVSSENFEETGEEESDGYADVISRLRRDKNLEKRKWEYEADMLADFGKDPELCMRAVCVLYRFQTEDEKVARSSHVSNGRGFSKPDAVRGTRIGSFLTGGDPEGDLKKSVEELKSFEFGAVKICRDLADKYSNQLFQIYNNREDQFFAAPPSP